tara:strand:+ start:482 stop:703 length:222 start_codon:yes stop_codon:yes gene_type:complete
MDINKVISILRSLKEEAMAAPTNSVGDGSQTALPPTHEPPGIPSSKKKKKKDWNYLKGGKGSRKFWLQNLKKK